MSNTRPAVGYRMRAYAYTLVTTAIVLVFALAEWGTERYLSDRSRAASTAVEAAIVLVAALLFRPVHRRVEGAIDSAFYRRKHQALAALTKFRREIGSYNDTGQLLRRAIEAIEHHFEARACAMYVRRGAFRAEASSFDVPAEDIDSSDSLVVRFRSSSAPARPRMLKSSALGTHAFPMTAAGDLVGFLLVDRQNGDYDTEEMQMLGGIAADLAVALIALDPLLRRKHNAATNIPANLAPLVGREHELKELGAALAQSRLVTVTGAGGVGKTRIALQCAADAMPRHEHGAWFVNLTPIGDGSLIATSIASALDCPSGEQGDDLASLIDYLRPRNALLVIDNCEHVIAGAAAAIAQIRAKCPNVTILATSRELLRLEGEQVYRLAPLRLQAAVELFAQRAAAVSPGFDAQSCADAVARLCERLDGFPLAIELAAARVRALSVDEILQHLNERFRLLTSAARGGEARQQTLAATIEWSYDLLTPQEQSLFRRLAVFRGSFSLPAAVALCAREERCDEYHVLDLLTSLADKSLLIVNLALVTRYRLLETLREFAAHKAVEHQAAAIAQDQHAAYFSAAAAQAYHEFDSLLPAGWLEGLEPDIDNFRAALSWTLEGSGDRRTGAQLAADCGPIFLRLELLREGLRWCESARSVAGTSPSTAGRIDYVASMMYNNIGDNRAALACAERALGFYRDSSDERGFIRALSQVAQLYARAKRFDDARSPAEEALTRARALGEPRVLIGVLRRCAFALPQDDVETARQYYQEALALARTVQEPEEACRVLQWWAYREAAWGCLERAIELAGEGLSCADRESQMFLENQLTTWMLALGRVEESAPHAQAALDLSVEMQHEQLRALATAYCAPAHAEVDPEEAAMLVGYARARLAQLEWEAQPDDELALASAVKAIQRGLGDGAVPPLLARGAGLSEDQALAILRSGSTRRRESHSAPLGGSNRVGTLLS